MSDVLLTRRGSLWLKSGGVLVAIFVVAPVLVMVPLSLSGDRTLLIPPRSLSLEWFANLVEQPRWRNAAWLSFLAAISAAVIATVLGTMAAVGLSRLPGRSARILKLLFIAPMIVPLMVIAVGFYVYFSKIGLVGRFASLPLSHAVLGVPFVVLPVLARLSAIEDQLERAAASLGATQAGIFRRITLPQLYPAIAAGFVMAFITSFDEVIVAQFLTGPRLETLPRRMWEGLTMGGLDNTITAIAVVQLAMALLALAAFEFFRRERPVSAQEIMPMQSPPPTLKPEGDSRAPAGHGGIPIRIDGVTKHYRGTAAVDQVDIQVAAGEFLTILGPSGSGKTTLLMLVAGFAEVDSGRLYFGGEDVSRLPPHRRDIGVVFQNYALFPHLSVRENVAFPLAVRGKLSKAEIGHRVDEALALVRLDGFGDRRIGQLSGGQQQRVALARATVFGPRALLMDEPLAALDKRLRLDMQAEIRALQRSVGHTTIYVTHDQEEALNLSDRIAVMNFGRLQQIGTPHELYFKPATPFVAGFFGDANLFRGKVQAGCFQAEGFEFRIPAPGLAGEPATACVRPDRVRIGREGLIEGIVVDVRFNGPVAKAQIETPVGRLSASLPTGGGAWIPEQGQPVALSFDPSDVHLMAGSR